MLSLPWEMAGLMLRLLPGPINPLLPPRKEETGPKQAGNCVKSPCVGLVSWCFSLVGKTEYYSCFLPPFLGGRAVASKFLNELRCPPSPLFSGHQTWIKAFRYSRCGFLCPGDFLQPQSPITFPAWVPRERVEGDPIQWIWSCCLQKFIPVLPAGKGRDWPLPVALGHPLLPQFPNLKPRFTSRERWGKL